MLFKFYSFSATPPAREGGLNLKLRMKQLCHWRPSAEGRLLLDVLINHSIFQNKIEFDQSLTRAWSYQSMFSYEYLHSAADASPSATSNTKCKVDSFKNINSNEGVFNLAHGFDIQCNRIASQCFDKDLQASTEATEAQSEHGVLTWSERKH